MRFCIALLFLVLGIALISGVLGFGPVASAALCIGTVLASVVVKNVIAPVSDSIIDTGGPFG